MLGHPHFHGLLPGPDVEGCAKIHYHRILNARILGEFIYAHILPTQPVKLTSPEKKHL